MNENSTHFNIVKLIIFKNLSRTQKMAIYQVYNYSEIALTTNFEQAKRLLKQVERGKYSCGGIYFLKLDRETGEFREEDFVKSEDVDQPFMKITEEERKLPEKLFNLYMGGKREIEHRIFLREKDLLKNLEPYHERCEKLFSSFGFYEDNFSAYLLYDEAIKGFRDKRDMSFEEVIEKVKSIYNFVGEIKMEEITNLHRMRKIEEIYLPRIEIKNLKKAFDLAKQYVNIG